VVQNLLTFDAARLSCALGICPARPPSRIDVHRCNVFSFLHDAILLLTRYLFDRSLSESVHRNILYADREFLGRFNLEGQHSDIKFKSFLWLCYSITPQMYSYSRMPCRHSSSLFKLVGLGGHSTYNTVSISEVACRLNILMLTYP
jgi:hypothetical protein